MRGAAEPFRGGAQPFREGAPRVVVAGATGFAGALAAQLLWRHPGFELFAVTGRSDTGRPLEALYPRYRVPLEVEELEVSRLEGVDAAIVAYPHAAAAPTVALLRELGMRVVDLSADFRLASLATYERWYGPHPRPELLDEAVYGLTELHRAQRVQPAALPGEDHRRRRHTAGGEARGAHRRGGVAHEQTEVGPAAGLDAARDARRAKAGRQPRSATEIAHMAGQRRPARVKGIPRRRRPGVAAGAALIGSADAHSRPSVSGSEYMTLRF